MTSRSIQTVIAQAVTSRPTSINPTAESSPEADPEPEVNSGLRSPLYDVRISASIREPEEFDPYALRQRVTTLLVKRFGLEIHVNGKCQPPCGRWDTQRDDRPL